MAFKHVAMSIAIAIMFALLIGLGIDAFYPAPEYSDYCNEQFPVPRKISYPENCPDTSKYYEQCGKGTPVFDYDTEGCQVFKECDMCNVDFREADAKYNQILFYLASIIGLIGIIFGIYWRVDFMGSGIMVGGILLMLYGTARYFGDMSRMMRFVVILIEFIVLILISYKKLVEKPVKKKRKS